MRNQSDTARFQRALIASAAFVVLLWLIKSFESISGTALRTHAIYPRDVENLYGIFLAPLLHGSYSHLAANSLPLLVLGSSVLYGYPRAAKFIIPAVYLGSGLGVWLYGRASYHLGASGLTFGLMFFVFTIGVLRWDRRASALSMLVFFLYGGMIWGIFPSRPEISFEYHFFGAALGVIGAVALRRLDPAPPVKRYSWEFEDEEDVHPYWLEETDEQATGADIPPTKPADKQSKRE